MDNPDTKINLLNQLNRLYDEGMNPTKYFNMDTPLEEIEAELGLLKYKKQEKNVKDTCDRAKQFYEVFLENHPYIKRLEMHNSEVASGLTKDLSNLATKQLDKLEKRVLNPFDKESEVTETDKGEMYMLLMSVILPAFVTAEQIEANWQALKNKAANGEENNS